MGYKAIEWAHAQIETRDDLKPSDASVLTNIAFCAADQNGGVEARAYPGTALLCRRTCLGRSTVHSSVSRLHLYGLLRRVRRQRADGSYQSNDYYLPVGLDSTEVGRIESARQAVAGAEKYGPLIRAVMDDLVSEEAVNRYSDVVQHSDHLLQHLEEGGPASGGGWSSIWRRVVQHLDIMNSQGSSQCNSQIEKEDEDDDHDSSSSSSLSNGNDTDDTDDTDTIHTEHSDDTVHDERDERPDSELTPEELEDRYPPKRCLAYLITALDDACVGIPWESGCETVFTPAIRARVDSVLCGEDGEDCHPAITRHTVDDIFKRIEGLHQSTDSVEKDLRDWKDKGLKPHLLHKLIKSELDGMVKGTKAREELDVNS